MPIRQLPQSLINKIAAGEVIERPASVVKELMENAVDAGSTRIDVTVVKGGTELIRIVDNGCGIPTDELPLAVASHATSKLADVDDLFRIGTLGFRGEALASIGEISRMTIRSRTAGADGSELRLTGGSLQPIAPTGCPTGTSIEVAELFFNTPVRRKFMRTVPTELGHITEAFTRIAMPRPDIHFTLKHNDRTLFDLPAVDRWKDRIAAFFGRDLAECLIRVESEDDGIRLAGYVADPTQSRANTKMQYLFLNGRHIRDRSLQHALTEAYRGLLTTGRQPIAFLRLDMPADMVDVNVHPTKLEVRFQDSGRHYGQLLSTLRSTFLKTDLSARVKTDDAESDQRSDEEKEVEHQEAVAMHRRQLIDWAKGEIDSWDEDDGEGDGASRRRESSRESVSAYSPGFGRGGGRGSYGGSGGYGGGAPAARRTDADRSHEPLEIVGIDPVGHPIAAPHDRSAFSGRSSDDASNESDGAEDSSQPCFAGPTIAAGGRAIQLHDRYIVAQTEEGVAIIDQHALHERIIYERLKRDLESGPVQTQLLLVPEPVDLTADEAGVAIDNAELLASIGLPIEPFGGSTILVTGYPSMLEGRPVGELLREAIELLTEGGRAPDRHDLIETMLHSIACKAAIKAGQRLAPEEIDALIAERAHVSDAHHCPHGRPAELIFSREELDKRFRRT